MTNIFLSYKREDEARVGRLVQALEKVCLKPWWDRGLPGGENWRANIQSALDAAKCVIVVWTRKSIGPAGDFVRDEAGQAKERGILVPVILEHGARPPLGFGEMQAIDLSHWRGGLSDPFFRDLVAAVQAKLSGEPAPPARGPMARLVRRLTLGSIVSAAAACLVGFALNLFSAQDYACTIAPQPFVSDVCGAVGLGHRPTHEERVAFEALPPGDCAALEVYRDRYEGSPLRELADSRINARVTMHEEQWIEGERRLALFSGGASEPQARARAGPQAERLCSGFAATTQFQLLSAEADGAFSCAEGACGLTGDAICHLRERQVVSREICGAPE